MNLQQRIANYEAETGFPPCMAVGPDGRLFGIWVMGQSYRVRSGYHGGYPDGYLRRVKALFPEKRSVLHVFSGRVDTSILPGHTVDLDPAGKPDYLDDAQSLENVPVDLYDLVIADPPYSVEDAEHYKPSMVKRNKVMDALSRLSPGAHVVWLDQVLPMYRSANFVVEGYIGMVKSTNHRFRVVTIFRRR